MTTATAVTLLNKTYLASMLNEQDVEIDDLGNYERAWNIISSCHDIPNIKNLQDCENELVSWETRFLNEHCDEVQDSISVPDRVDADLLLGVTKKVGLVCPKCYEQETTYKFLATRSADEGMPTYCTCRSCSHVWTMTI